MYNNYDNNNFLSHNHTQDAFNAFNCTCVEGYVGGQCQTNIDDCVLRQPCLNGGSCYDLVNDYLCSCVNDYIVSCDIRPLHTCMSTAFVLYNTCLLILQFSLLDLLSLD